MNEKFARAMSQILFVAERVPGAIDVLAANARKIKAIREDFRETHWGDDEIGVTSEVRIPTASSGVVALGDLVSVVYLASKAGRLHEWEHRFEGPRPILSYAHDGSGLIVVRGDSDYTITRKGIEG